MNNPTQTPENDSETSSDPLLPKSGLIVVKFGGNAMKDDSIKENVIENLCELHSSGYKIVLVHGGGPAISKTLDMAGIESEFVGGHRKTTDESIAYVEMALKGQVNGELVRLINTKGKKAVGLSGKDGSTVRAVKRFHKHEVKGKEISVDLGQVGDVEIINSDLVQLLSSAGYIPVIAPIAYGEDFSDYNINADMFAGHMASALKADGFVVLTDVDGLMRDKDDPKSLIKAISVNDVKKEIGGIIQGGMIPKIESCISALDGGVEQAHIVNGTKKNVLSRLFLKGESGTIITK